MHLCTGGKKVKPLTPFLFIFFVTCSLMAQERPNLLWEQTGGITSQNAGSVDTALTPQVTRLKSENRAFKLSLWSTLIPTLTVFGSPLGLIVGPSVGYFYGGAPGRGWLGIGIRTVGFGGMIGSLAATWDCSGGECDVGLAVFTAGAVITLGSAIIDIATVKAAVRKHNQSLQKTGWMITPKFLAQHRAGVLELQLNW